MMLNLIASMFMVGDQEQFYFFLIKIRNKILYTFLLMLII